MYKSMIVYCSVILFSLFNITGCSRTETNSTEQSETASYPDSADNVRPLLIGQTVPSILLKDTRGEPFDLNDVLAKKPTILIFYRGGWCPYCNLHLAEIRNIEDDLQKLGFQIIAISPDRPELLISTIKKNDLGYKLFSDSEMKAAKALGIAFRVAEETVSLYKDKHGIDIEADSGQTHHLLPVPSVFVINRDGMITFSYVNPNYKVRIDAPFLLEAARSLLRQNAK